MSAGSVGRRRVDPKAGQQIQAMERLLKLAFCGGAVFVALQVSIMIHAPAERAAKDDTPLSLDLSPSAHRQVLDRNLRRRPIESHGEMPG